MPIKSHRHYDNDIRKLSEAGLSIKDIAQRLGLSFSIVHDRRQSMRISKKFETYDVSIDVYTEKPLVERKCPACGARHMTHPNTWTCEQCREDRDGVDTSVWLDRHGPRRGPRRPGILVSVS